MFNKNRCACHGGASLAGRVMVLNGAPADGGLDYVASVHQCANVTHVGWISGRSDAHIHLKLMCTFIYIHVQHLYNNNKSIPCIQLDVGIDHARLTLLYVS